MRRFDRVLELVLPVRRPKFQPPDDLHDLWMKTGDARLIGGRLALLLDLLLDLLLGLGHDLLDPRRMDAAILHQLGERQPGDLPPYRVEARQRDRVRRVVDDQVDPGHGFQGADVAALAADDAALHLLVRDLHHAGRDLADRIARIALDGHRQDLARLALGRLARLQLDQAGAAGRLGAHLLLDPVQQQVARLVARKRRHPLDRRHLLHPQPLDIGLTGDQPLLALLEHVLSAIQLLQLAVEMLLFLPQPSLLGLQLRPCLTRRGLRLRPLADGLLLGFQQDGLALRLGVCPRLLEADLRGRDVLGRGIAFQDVAQPRAGGEGSQGYDKQYQ